ncbi:type II toxin-antitoxin system RelB/DinJ family antitoxin [Bacillus cereus group sp. BceL297]|uniref:type II toxin-antitoxin system RelB/DinJ family antitoxin n=1 Tax=unclassified Bacillus cereus group TaxID=2750818 RepID=UPI003F29A88E
MTTHKEKYGKYDRRSQEVIRFRTDEMTKKHFYQICKEKGISVQQFLEEFIKETIVESQLEKERN